MLRTEQKTSSVNAFIYFSIIQLIKQKIKQEVNLKENICDKRKLKGEDTKRRLYAIAEKLFRENDVSDVTIEMITGQAGITKGAFYVHFESKDALISQLVADYTSRVDTGYKAFLDALPEAMPTGEVLLALCGKISDTLMNDIGCDNMKKVYLLFLNGSPGTQAVKDYDRELYTLFCGILEKGVAHGEVTASLSPDMLSRCLVTALRGVCVEWCARFPDYDLKKQTATHVRLVLEGISTNER